MEEDIKFETFIEQHKAQLVPSLVPEHFWGTLYNKLNGQIFDAGEVFAIMKIEYEEKNGKHFPSCKVIVSSENGVKKDDPRHIYLIDHAWTYSPTEAKKNLVTTPGLLDRMCDLMDIQSTTTENRIDDVFNEMWRFNQTYNIASGPRVEDRLPVWYIMDEFGSSIQHSDNPNFRIVPFAFVSEGMMYSILFPIKDVSVDEEVSRDYVEGFSSELVRQCLLLPWFPKDLKHIDFKQSEPCKEYFTSGHINESLPNLENLLLSEDICESRQVLKVYSDYEFVNSYLTDPRFKIVDDEEEAHILWYTNHFVKFKEFSELYPEKFVNQFPYEFVITVKDLLSVIGRRAVKDETKFDCETLDIFPLWLPETFNLNTELPQFVSYFQEREEKGLDNHWICKPWNLARGLDTHISNDLNLLVRLPVSGPKIAQKYIHDPVLFYRPEIEGSGLVKFDIRYIVVLKSVKPLEVYAYRNFFLRFANKPFDLSEFDVYEKHFTVMNYADDTPLCRMLCDEFIQKFESQYSDEKWDIVEGKIFNMFKELFKAAVECEPPCGIGMSPQSRAVYGIDLMISYSTRSKEIQPKLLEVNWIPDCQRACVYYPDFYNDIFALCFLNEMKPVFQKL